MTFKIKMIRFSFQIFGLWRCAHIPHSIFVIPLFSLYFMQINDFHLLLSWVSLEGLLRMPCYGGDHSSTGLYLESSMACSSSLVFDVSSVTQHCRIMARCDLVHLYMSVIIK